MNFKSTFLFFVLFAFVLSAFAQNELIDSSIYKLIDLEDVVVTAQYAPTDSRSAVHEVRTLKLETIEKRGANNLAQLLSQEASIKISPDLVLGSSLSLLGVSGQNVKIMVDGVPVIGRQNGNINLDQINLNQIARIEIVEGPLSVSYGTDALAGVINLITKKSQLKKFDAGVTAQAETRGENSYSANFGVRLTEKLLLRANAGFDDFNGFNEDTLRSVVWNPKEQIYADASLRYNFGESQNLRYNFSWFDESVDDLSGELRSKRFNPYYFDNLYQTRRRNHSLSYEGTINEKYYVQTVVGYNQWFRKRNTFKTYADTTFQEIFGKQDTSSFSAVSLRSTFASQFESDLNFQIGIDGRYDNATSDQIIDTLTTGKANFSETSDYAVFGSIRYQPMEALSLEGGLRYIYNTRYDAPIVPSFNAKFDLSKNLQLRGSYAQGFRYPSIKELFFRLVDAMHNVKGNPNLIPENSNNFQLGLNFQKNIYGHKIELNTKGFFNDIKDKIEQYEFAENPDGTINPVPINSTFQFTYFNLDRFKTRGLNLRLDYEFKKFRWNSGVSFIGFYNPTSEQFAEVETFTNTFELSNEFSFFFNKHDLNLSLFNRINDKQVTYFPDQDEEGNDIAGQRVTKGLIFTDFTATKGFYKKKLNVTVGVRNIFNVRTTTRTGPSDGNFHETIVGEIPASPGRNFFIRASYKIAWN